MKFYSEDEIRPLIEALYYFAKNFDCDSDAHTYDTVCRSCESGKALTAFRAVKPQVAREWNELKEKVTLLRSTLEAVRSQMCWERDRDQLTMGMSDLHTSVTKVLKDMRGAE